MLTNIFSNIFFSGENMTGSVNIQARFSVNNIPTNLVSNNKYYLLLILKKCFYLIFAKYLHSW